MGRPRNFCLEATLEQVTKVFWEFGYERTSLSQLEEVTGLKKASLCVAYGDKRTLFIRALERYETENVRKLKELFAKEDLKPSQILRKWLEEFLCPDKNNSCRGCFLLNTQVETAPHDKDCARIVRSYRRQMLKLLVTLLQRGVDSNEFRADLDLDRSADALFCLACGYLASARLETGSERNQQMVQSLARFALEALS